MDNQTHVDVHVLQGEREMAKDCRSLARFKLGPLQGQPAGYPKIGVTFLIDAKMCIRDRLWMWGIVRRLRTIYGAGGEFCLIEKTAL